MQTILASQRPLGGFLALLACSTVLSQAGAQCLQARYDLTPESAQSLEASALSGSWLVLGLRGSQQTFDFKWQLHQQTPGGQWQLAQELTSPPELVNQRLALQGERLCIVKGQSLQLYAVSAGVWSPLGPSHGLSYAPREVAIDGQWLALASSELHIEAGQALHGRVELFRIEADGQLTPWFQLQGTQFGEGLGTGLDLSDGWMAYSSYCDCSLGSKVIVGQIPNAPGNLLFPTTIQSLIPGSPLGLKVDLSGGFLATPSPSVAGQLAIFERGPGQQYQLDDLIEKPAGLSSWGRFALSGATLVVDGTSDMDSEDRFHQVYQRFNGDWLLRTTLDEPEPAQFENDPLLDSGRLFYSGRLGTFLATKTRAWLWSLPGLNCPGALLSPSQVSLSNGATVEHITSFAPLANGQLYLVVGSLSGTSPGVTINGLTVPLNPDAWTTFTLTQANQAPFSQTLGLLDSLGSAYSQLTIPPGTNPALAGLSLTQVSLRLDPSTGTLLGSSSPAATQLVP